MKVAEQLTQLANQYQKILQNAQQAELVLLENYHLQLNDLSRIYTQTPETKTSPLTIPAVFGRSHRENFISDYLAYILDPTKNGIGVAPLSALLELCQVPPDSLHLDEVEIYREYPLDNLYNRISIPPMITQMPPIPNEIIPKIIITIPVIIRSICTMKFHALLVKIFNPIRKQRTPITMLIAVPA